jgi:hypothetical protein
MDANNTMGSQEFLQHLWEPSKPCMLSHLARDSWSGGRFCVFLSDGRYLKKIQINIVHSANV